MTHCYGHRNKSERDRHNEYKLTTIILARPVCAPLVTEMTENPLCKYTIMNGELDPTEARPHLSTFPSVCSVENKIIIQILYQ